MTKAFKVLEKLLDNGYDARIAGGAVRDLVLGIEPKDWDIATIATPYQVSELFPNTVPTGIDHGTVTVLMDGETYEVTTLRKDITTDGRRAVVAFTKDWYEDSIRRDFAFNAMYMDYYGEIYDYHGGTYDLENGYIRFVGDAETRIKEDYLRILRFFRFSARFGSKINQDHYDVIQKTMQGLEQISVERIWSEIKKLHSEPSYNSILWHMNRIGVSEIIGVKDGFATEFNGVVCPDILNIYYSTFYKNRNVNLYRDWKMSVDEANMLHMFYLLHSLSTEDIINLSTHNPNVKRCVDSMVINSSMFPEHTNTLKKFFSKHGILIFPFNGRDLQAEGFFGMELGEELNRRKIEYIKGLLTNLNT